MKALSLTQPSWQAQPDKETMSATPADQLTLAERCECLAQLEVDCPNYPPVVQLGGVHEPACPGGCKGTGQVPRFPMLREPCVFEDVSYPEYRVHGQNCQCQGRGWVPVTTLEALLEALWSAGLIVSTWTQRAIEISNLEETQVWGASGRGVEALARALVMVEKHDRDRNV